MGKVKTDKVCPKFRKNIHNMKGMDRDEHSAMEMLGKMLGKIHGDRLGVLGLILLQEQETRDAGFKFFQRVYVRYRGRATSNYLSNFMAAHVLYATKKQIVLMSSDGKVTLTYPNTGTEGKNLYTTKQFKALRLEMEQQEKFVDPEIKKPVPQNRKPEELDDVRAAVESSKGAVADIDSVFRASTKGKKGKKKSDKKKSQRMTLRDAADAILSGEIDPTNLPTDFDAYDGLGDVDDYGSEEERHTDHAFGNISTDEHGNRTFEC